MSVQPLFRALSRLGPARRCQSARNRLPAGFVMCKPDGSILEANAAMASLLGCRASADLEGLSFAELAPNDWPAISAAMRTKRRVESAELALQRIDGSTAWVIMSFAAVFDHGRRTIQATAIDITDKKRRDDALQRQAEIEAAISAIYSDLLLTDPDDLDVAVERGLHRIGIYTGARRAHFLTFVDGGRALRSEYEWCAEETPHRFSPGRIVSGRALGGLLRQFRTMRSVAASQLTEIHPRVRRLLASQSISALIAAPLVGAGEAIGVIGLECSYERGWGEETLLMLQLGAETFARAIDRKRMQDALRTANRRLEDGVSQRTAELRALTAKLLRVQEEERSSLSRDIHDELGQALTELHLGIAALKPAESRPEQLRSIDDLGDLVRRTIQSLQRVAGELRPALLDRVGVVAAIEAKVESVRIRSGIRTSLKIDPCGVDLDAARATAVYRIVQEALTNVSRHSRATRLDVRLHCRRRALILTIRDNGIGIAAERIAGVHSLGLLGMGERARMFGGQLRIRGRAGRGTVVRLRLPRGEVRGMD